LDIFPQDTTKVKIDLFDSYEDDGTDVLFATASLDVKGWISNGRFEGHVDLHEPITKEIVGNIQLNARMSFHSDNGSGSATSVEEGKVSSAVGPYAYFYA
jgi:hypothetical protein